MTDSIKELKYEGTSRLMSKIILLCNKELGWPLRTTHGEMGTVYAEYRAHGATITLYGSLVSSKSDDLEIHLRIHEFTGDMTRVIDSLSRQIDGILHDPDVQDNRYIIFEEKRHEPVSQVRKVSPQDNSCDQPDGDRIL